MNVGVCLSACPDVNAPDRVSESLHRERNSSKGQFSSYLKMLSMISMCTKGQNTQRKKKKN